MSAYKLNPQDTERLLREAANIIDHVLDWSQTDEGPDFWEEVTDALENYIADASAHSAHSQGGNQVAPAPTSGTVPPPLHTLVPNKKTAKSGWAPPPLDTLVQKGRRQSAVVPSSSPATKEEVVHIYHNGGALCGIRGNPSSWPTGHFRVNVNEAHKATCAACAAKKHELQLETV